MKNTSSYPLNLVLKLKYENQKQIAHDSEVELWVFYKLISQYKLVD